MANFSLPNSTATAGTSQAALATTYKSLCIVAASTGSGATAGTGLRRGKLYDILIGTNGVPADNFLEFDVARCTIGTTPAIAGSVSSVSSAYMLDTADTGFFSFASINSSNEGIVTANSEVWYEGLNQRASYRWVSAPGSELVYPAVSSATGNNGFALRARSGGYTGTATGNLLVNEQ